MNGRTRVRSAALVAAVVVLVAVSAVPTCNAQRSMIGDAVTSNAMNAALGPEYPQGSNPGDVTSAITGPMSQPVGLPADVQPAVQPILSQAAGVLSQKINSAPPGTDQEHKPKILDAFKPHLFQFMKNPNMESCADLSEELSQNEATAQAHVYFDVIINMLRTELFDSKAERITADKNTQQSLEDLQGEIVKEGGDGSSGDLVNYMDRILKCKVQPVEEGKGILQKILELGFEKSLKTPFSENLLRGSTDFDPALIVDNKGNNLMHLASLSGGHHVPSNLFSLEYKKNMGDPSRKMNGIFWMLSALASSNDEGKRPLDIVKDPNTRAQLKKYFRTYTNYMKIRHRQLGITKSAMAHVDDFLQSTPQSIPVPAAPVQQPVQPHVPESQAPASVGPVSAAPEWSTAPSSQAVPMPKSADTFKQHFSNLSSRLPATGGYAPAMKPNFGLPAAA